MQARSTLSAGTEVSIRFQIPYLGDTVEAKGIVRWRQLDVRQDETTGVGIEFIEIPQQARDRLVQYVEAQSLGVL